MNRRTIFFALVLNVTSCLAQNVYKVEFAEDSSSFCKIYESEKKIILKECYYIKDSTLQSTETYIDNKLFGTKSFYYPNGKLSGTINYIDGKEVGLRREYYSNGNLFVQEEFKLNNFDTSDVEYCSEEISSIGTSPGEFTAFGNTCYKSPKEGKSVYYFENGNKYLEGYFKNNKRVGIWYYYHEFGRLDKKKDYGNGSGNQSILGN
jgi:antitoxin component YwqK of YwqJK toxin-antitoxin module